MDAESRMETAGEVSDSDGDYAAPDAGPLDDTFLDLEGEDETVRVWVNTMQTRMPVELAEHVEDFRRRNTLSRLLLLYTARVFQDELGQRTATKHVLGAGSTQIHKTFLPAVPSLVGRWLRCPVGVVSKTVANQLDVTSKINSNFLPGFNVKVVTASKRGYEEILEEYDTTTFVMAATKPQLTVFLHAMAKLQRDQKVRSWFLVQDESDALKT